MKPMMVTVALVVTVFVVTLFTVTIVRKEKKAQFFNGTYIRFSHHEFGKEWDTLTIKRIEETDRYLIVRRWRYERVLDGNMLEPEYKKFKTTGQYLEKENLIVEEDSGLRFQWLEQKNELWAGTTIYQKIKES